VKLVSSWAVETQPVERLRGHKVIALNSSYERVPFADICRSPTRAGIACTKAGGASSLRGPTRNVLAALSRSASTEGKGAALTMNRIRGAER
jgi:hypothetical protein